MDLLYRLTQTRYFVAHVRPALQPRAHAIPQTLPGSTPWAQLAVGMRLPSSDCWSLTSIPCPCAAFVPYWPHLATAFLEKIGASIIILKTLPVLTAVFLVGVPRLARNPGLRDALDDSAMHALEAGLPGVQASGAEESRRSVDKQPLAQKGFQGSKALDCNLLFVVCGYRPGPGAASPCEHGLGKPHVACASARGTALGGLIAAERHYCLPSTFYFPSPVLWLTSHNDASLLARWFLHFRGHSQG